MPLSGSKETDIRITIAGYGNIGQWIQGIFGPHHETAIYDPPKGLGHPDELRNADVVFISVPTHSLPDGSCDTSVVEEIVAQAQPRQAIICHSTVTVGTTERLIRTHGKPLVFVPEYAGESPDHLYRQMENRTFFILGGYEPALSRVRELFETVYGDASQYFSVTPTVAELVKYMDNTFLALKVGFCNEFYDLARAFEVDYEEVRRLWLLDRRISPSHTIVTPERGYGGSCFPKDIAAVCFTGREMGTPIEILETVQRVNKRHRSHTEPLEPAL